MNDVLLIALFGLAITAGLLGMNIALKIMKSIPFFNQSYPMVHSGIHPSIPTPMPNNNETGLSFNFFLLVFLVMFIYWVFNNSESSGNQNDSIPQKKETPSEELEEQAQNVLKWDSMPVSYYEDTLSKRINQAPQNEVSIVKEEIFGNFYIQLTAVSTYDWAEEFSNSLVKDNIIIKEDNKFKVLVGPFISSEFAKKQQIEDYQLQKGFVRKLILAYHP